MKTFSVESIENCAADPSLWVVEWSPDQRCSHISQLGEILEMNREIALQRSDVKPTGYIPLAIFVTADEAEEFAKAIEQHVRGN